MFLMPMYKISERRGRSEVGRDGEGGRRGEKE